ncbi:MAG: hypothetical protein K9K66_10225 [Desulfarculaceae bacterium]|nr:hypothetical protein [Desulfarculaceae bacterium]MCF8073784.1 hypothetical protein [Desulfarculaceae bacterium]MCF8102025.1 hypothetical protein [Desulfarculaceae bacterium]MCF8115995.1 hypothetical protein [Desulfarculaceae bacterium]
MKEEQIGYDLELSRSLEKTISSPDMERLLIDYADLGIKSFVDGPAKEIPFAKSFIAITKFGLAFRDEILIRKIIVFLTELTGTTAKEREKFILKMKKDPYEKRVGDTLLILIDRMNHMEKPKLMARAIRLFIKEEIDIETLLRLWNAIDKIDVINIGYLRSFYSDEPTITNTAFGRTINQNLAMSGLLTIGSVANQMMLTAPDEEVDGSEKHNNTVFFPNKLGEAFCKLL